MHLRSLLPALVFFHLLQSVHVGHAQSTWTGATSNNWFFGGNWSGGVPTSSSFAVIDNNGTAEISTGGAAVADSLEIGINGPNDLNGAVSITNGTLDIRALLVAGSGQTATLSLSGASSHLINTSPGNFSIGIQGVGNFTLAGGATFVHNSGLIQLGVAAGATGTILVEGSGSTLTGGTSTDIRIGTAGTGAFTVRDAGRASFAIAGSGVDLAVSAGSQGTLNIEGTSGSRGVFGATAISEGSGDGLINFDGGILRALGTQADFLRNFESGDVTINAGGAFIDTNGFNVGIAAPMVDGGGGLTKMGAGTLTLSGANTYTGGTTIEQGTLAVGANNNLGGAGGLTFVTGTLQTTAGFTMNRAISVGAGGGLIDTVAGSLLQSGVISGPGALIKTGAGLLRLSSSNTFDGGVILHQGTLEVGNNNALGDGNMTVNGGTLSTNGSAKAVNNNIVVGADFSIYPRGTLVNISSFRFNGNVDLGGAFRTITNPSDFSAGDFGEVRFDGAFSNGGVYFNSNGTSDLAAFSLRGTQANTYTGLTRLGYGVSVQLLKTAGVTAIAGDAQIDNNGVIAVDSNEQIADSSTVTVNGIGRLQIGAGNDVTETIETLMGDGEVALKDSDSGGSFVLQEGTFSGQITGGVATNTASVTKTGTGTLTLSGNSTYLGGTQVNAGTLVVDGSLGDTDVTLASGAELQGIGTINGSLSSSGTISPGNSPGVLTVGQLTLNPSSVLDFELGAASDRIDVVADLGGFGSSGNLTLDGTLNISSSGGFAAGSYTLFNYGGSLSGPGLDFGIAPGGFDLSITTTLTQVILDVTAVTEQYWDGPDTLPNTIDGGTGDWDNSTTNWTNSTGTVNGTWAGQGAIFGGAMAGTASVTENVNFRSLRFVLDGYVVDSTGGDLVAVDNTAIIADLGVTAEISAAITGTVDDTVEITGGGTVILSGVNTYGGGTLLSQGTLQIDNNDALGTGEFFVQGGTTISSGTGAEILNRTFLQGNVTMQGFAGLTFSGQTILGDSVRTVDIEGAVAFNGAILGGPDSGLHFNSPTLALVLISGADDNSFSSLRIGSNVDVILAKDPGILGISGDLRIDNGGQLDVIYDSGASPIAATTNLRLDGRIDFDSLTTLDITFASLTGASTGELCNFCSLSPLNLTILSGDYAGMIFDEEFGLTGGILTLIKDGPGTLTLSGNNTYRGATLINGGRLIAASNTAISNTAVTVDGSTSVLQINRRVTLSNPLTLNNEGSLDNFGTYNGNIRVGGGGGAIFNQHGGRINGNLVATGPVTLEIQDGSYFSGDLDFGNDESALILGGSGDSSVNDAIGGRISGRYGLVKAGSGEWTLDRDLAPALGTVIDQGTLTIGNKGSIKGDIVNNGELRIDRTRDYTFEGAIFGDGDLIQDGTSNTILLGELGYTGTTYVNSGGIILGNGKEASSLAGDVVVADGAFFGGEGTINGSFSAAGMISPGYSPGTLEIRDNFTLRSTAILVIEINSAKKFDRLIVGGKAKVDGTLRVVLSDRYDPENGSSFVIITAKSVKGEFDRLDGSSMWEAVYGPETVTLVFGQPQRRPYQYYAETPNQYNVAVALETLRTQDLGDNTDFNNKVRPVLDSLTPGELREAFEAILPTQSAAFADISFARSRVFLPQMATRLADIRAGSRGFVASGFNQMGAADMKDVLAPTPENKWGVWVDGSGVFSEVAGFDGLRTGDASGAAATVGVDYRVSDNFIVGLYTGYIGSWTDFGGNSEVDSNGTRFGIYSTYQSGGFYLNNVIGGEWNSYDWSRGINFPGLSRTARADTQGTVFETMFGGGYDWKVCEWGTVGAFTALEYTLLNVDGFREKGAQSLNLKIRDQDADSLRTNLGMQFTGDLPIGQRRLRPSLRAAWRHEYLDGSRRINSTLVGGTGPGFSTLLPGGSRKDSLLLNGGFSMELTENVSGYLYYTGDIAGGESENIHAVNAGLRLAF